ncbi:hypothetical protein C8Q77DRAFT_1149660 [Trametes polyzona]|nr:hypothetical protein C8Q77DRAFT_1149660 [Trametes polyzona]
MRYIGVLSALATRSCRLLRYVTFCSIELCFLASLCLAVGHAIRKMCQTASRRPAHGNLPSSTAYAVHHEATTPHRNSIQTRWCIFTGSRSQHLYGGHRVSSICAMSDEVKPQFGLFWGYER